MKSLPVVTTVLASLALTASQARAHPHVFIDAELELVMDETGLTEIRMVWKYDDFFSLLLTEDLGLDADLDGELTPAELQSLSDYVLDWPEGFEGDLVVQQGGRTLRVGPRSEAGLDYRAGRMIEAHARPLQVPSTAPITVKVFDPGYYTAYTVTEVEITGRDDCHVSVQRADIIAATERVDELLYATPQSDAEEAFPMVGEDFADTVTVTCDGSS